MALTAGSGVNGIIVVLDETGLLSCCFLGTDPSLPPVAAIARDINYEVSLSLSICLLSVSRSLFYHHVSLLTCIVLIESRKPMPSSGQFKKQSVERFPEVAATYVTHPLAIRAPLVITPT